MGKVIKVSPQLARDRHNEGMSCVNTAAYRYDANGHRIWCIDCGQELPEAAWHPDGADVPNWLIGTWIVGAAVIAALFLWLTALPAPGTTSRGWQAPTPAPAPYGQPEGR